MCVRETQVPRADFPASQSPIHTGKPQFMHPCNRERERERASETEREREGGAERESTNSGVRSVSLAKHKTSGRSVRLYLIFYKLELFVFGHAMGGWGGGAGERREIT